MEAEDVHHGLIDRRKGILSSRTGEGIVRIVASCMSAGALPIPPVSARRRVEISEAGVRRAPIARDAAVKREICVLPTDQRTLCAVIAKEIHWRIAVRVIHTVIGDGRAQQRNASHRLRDFVFGDADEIVLPRAGS